MVAALATLGGLIGTISFSGSLIAFAKLQGIMRKAFRLPAQNAMNMILAVLTILCGIGVVVRLEMDGDGRCLGALVACHREPAAVWAALPTPIEAARGAVGCSEHTFARASSWS